LIIFLLKHGLITSLTKYIQKNQAFKIFPSICDNLQYLRKLIGRLREKERNKQTKKERKKLNNFVGTHLFFRVIYFNLCTVYVIRFWTNKNEQFYYVFLSHIFLLFIVLLKYFVRHFSLSMKRNVERCLLLRNFFKFQV